MKILFENPINNSIKQQYFCARKSEIREADNIQRKTREVFPTMSSSYIDNFYLSSRNGSKNAKEANKLKKTLRKKISELRDDCVDASKQKEYCYYGPKFLYDLEQISKRKVGNCSENAKLALAVLCANGYYNSARAVLGIDIQFINKNTKQVEYNKQDRLDHCFVITDLNQRKEQDIVIDPWLGFAGYKQDAFVEFRTAFKSDIERFITQHSKLFNIDKMQKGEEFNFDDYEIKTDFNFLVLSDDKILNNKKTMGECVREAYPEIVLDITA